MTLQFVCKRFVVLIIFSTTSTCVYANDEKMDLYIKFHLSIDRGYDGQDQASSVSNNSSRFGFQGKHNIKKEYSFLWRIENKVYVDESGGKLGNPVYAGFKTKAGSILLGFIDTPYKSFVSKFNVMDDTIADVRSILGYNALGADATDNLNIRARNALLYKNKWGPYNLGMLYSAENGDQGTATGTDDNNLSGYSARLEYRQRYFTLGMAGEKWKGGNQLNGFRVGGRFRGNPVQGGVIWERIHSPTDSSYSRDAYALDIRYHATTKADIKTQYIVARPNKGTSNSGATMLAIGEYYKLDRKLSLYAIAANLTNSSNAKYRLGTSGHGDIISPSYGGDLWTLSLGLVFRIDMDIVNNQ